MVAAPDLLLVLHTVLPLILFQLFIHAPPIYALVRVWTNTCLESSSKNGIQREIGTTKHHLSHVIQTVPTQLPTILGWKRLGNVTPDDIEAAQLVE